MRRYIVCQDIGNILKINYYSIDPMFDSIDPMIDYTIMEVECNGILFKFKIYHKNRNILGFSNSF